MDIIQTGKFIAELRKEKGLTQEQLGDKIGVTNKTVSRWETGNYLPPADVLLEMSELFGVSINEILSGKRLAQEEYRQAAEENLRQAIRSGSFSRKEKTEFYRKKWLKEHLAILIFMGICILGICAAGILLRNMLLCCASLVLLLLAHGWRNNTMMAYIEGKIYGGAEAHRWQHDCD